MDKYTFLTDVEKELLIALNSNETQREALRKILMHGITTQGVLKAGEKPNPLHNWALSFATRQELSNEQIGQDLRAAAQGIMFLETAFSDLSKFVKVEQKEPKPKAHR